jgi:plasmid stability protein
MATRFDSVGGRPVASNTVPFWNRKEDAMRSLTIKNVPPPLLRRLKARAAANRRSLNLEVIASLESVSSTTPIDPEAFLVRARAIRARTTKQFRLNDTTLGKLKRAGRL